MANGNIARCFHSCDELRSEGYLSLTSTLASSRPTASICLTPGSPVSTLRLKLVILSNIQDGKLIKSYSLNLILYLSPNWTVWAGQMSPAPRSQRCILTINEIHFITFNPWNYLFAVSRMKKTQGLDVDQTTFTIGSLSTVPAQVIRGLG